MSIGTNKEYRLATALLQFKKAYGELVAASKALPDLDLSEMYPFYLLDFEDIVDAVQGWCSLHASRLMRTVPDIVDNPACLTCSWFRKGLNASGQCVGAAAVKCDIFPTCMFTREAVTPALTSRGFNLTGMDDASVQLLYMRLCDSIAAK